MRYDIAPVPKPRMTQRDKWLKRPCVLRYRAFADKCRARRVKLPGACRIVFHLPMPRTWSVSKRVQLQGAPHTTKPDLDNLIKALMDAVLKDDAHVFDIRAEKRWTLGKAYFEVEPA